MEDARHTLYIQNRVPTTLPEIAQASQINDATAFFEGNNRQINEASRLAQTHLFEDKLAQMLEEYRDANSAVKGKILDEISRGVNMIRNEKHRHEELQDPPEIQGNRTFGRGGLRKKTAAELAVARLEKEDRLPSRENHIIGASSAPQIPIMDLTSTPSTPNCIQQNSRPVIATISSSGPRILLPPTPISEPISTVNFTQTGAVSEIEIVEIWTKEELQAEAAEAITTLGDPCSKRRRLQRISPPDTEKSPQTSPQRPKRSAGLPYRYRQGKGMDVQSAKRRKQGS